MNPLIAGVLLFAAPPAPPAAAAPEYYRGTLTLNFFQERTLFLEVRPAVADLRPLVLDSVDISAMGIPGSTAQFGPAGGHLDFPVIKATFDAPRRR